MGNRDKDKDKEQHSDAEATGEAGESATAKEACNAHQASRDLSCGWAAAIDKLVAEAIARETAWITATFTVILNQNNVANMPTSLKVTSGATGIKAMPPFYWTKDKAIYQRWQLWSEKARYILDCMKGDSVKAKISYFYHWILTRNGLY